MNNTERNKRRLFNKEYKFIKEIAEKYRLKINPEYPAVIEKRYRDNTRFDIKQNNRQIYKNGEIKTTKDVVTLSIGKKSSTGSNGWISYFYYYDYDPTENENIEETIKMLIQGIKKRIQEDIEDEDSRRKYDAPYALKFVEFLEKKVFVKR